MWNTLLINMTHFYNNTIEWFMTPFRSYLGIYTFPSILASVIVSVYVTTRNIGATLFAILLTFGFYGDITDIDMPPELRLLSSIIAAAGLSGIVLSLFLKSRHG